jgi:peptidoglycan/xylan/chitin deacetylase (PgdA/CDA1 family)
MAANGYTSITNRELIAWLTRGEPLPEKPVMITVDDGYATDWLFLETLDRYGFNGNFLLPTYAEMTEAQIRTLPRAGEVCGHTVSHQVLSTLSYDRQYAEIANNKRFLEEIVGEPVTCFAYPFGDFDANTENILIDAGYLIAFDAWGGPVALEPADT